MCLNHKNRKKDSKDEIKIHEIVTIEKRKIGSASLVLGCLQILALLMKFVAFSVLLAGEVSSGQRCAGDVYGSSKVYDDGVVCHRGGGKAIVNSCMDRVKKSCYYTIAVSRRISDSEQ